jgi:hypothetical protein
MSLAVRRNILQNGWISFVVAGQPPVSWERSSVATVIADSRAAPPSLSETTS